MQLCTTSATVEPTTWYHAWPAIKLKHCPGWPRMLAQWPQRGEGTTGQCGGRRLQRRLRVPDKAISRGDRLCKEFVHVLSPLPPGGSIREFDRLGFGCGGVGRRARGA